MNAMGANIPLVTIGIPTYNRADKTLSCAIGSACSQDYPNLEIIVSDNCSTDNTQELVRSFNDHRIKYLRHDTNIGPNNNFNACLQAAKGDYFLLLHDDDLIDPDFVHTCLSRAAYGTQYGLIITGKRIIDGSGAVIKEKINAEADTPLSLYRAWLAGQIPFHLCSTLFNTRELKRIGGFHSRNNLFEDGIAIIKIAQQLPFLNIPEAKASFRKHPDQRTHFSDIGKWCEDFKEAIELICGAVETNREELYRQGMMRFSGVGLRFAKKIDNPIKKAVAVFNVNKTFPYRYWPKTSWKIRMIGFIGSLFHSADKPARPLEEKMEPNRRQH